MQPPTLAEFRAQLDASKARALAKFSRDWNGLSVAEVGEVLRRTIPGSASPAHAAAAALTIINA